jgi:hypothetical protein
MVGSFRFNPLIWKSFNSFDWLLAKIACIPFTAAP